MGKLVLLHKTPRTTEATPDSPVATPPGNGPFAAAALMVEWWATAWIVTAQLWRLPPVGGATTKPAAPAAVRTPLLRLQVDNTRLRAEPGPHAWCRSHR